jgi:hypothetical protein
MNPNDITNRFTYHPPKAEQPAVYTGIREAVKAVAEFLNAQCPESREKSLAITHLEEAVFWANASIAREDGAR